MSKDKKPIKETPDLKVKRKILETYISIVRQKSLFPTRADLAYAGLSRDKVRHHFVNLVGLRNAAKLHNPDVFEGVIDLEDYASEKAIRAIQKEVKKYKRFFITTAVNGQWVHPGFLDSIRTYCDKNKAKLLVLPSHDPAHNLDNDIEWHFDKSIISDPILFEEVHLNSNIHVSALRISAKQINPTTGLGRVCQGKGSFIFASPKQSLEFDPVSSEKLPHARMSTGACTIPNYKTTKGNSLRTAYLAENDHVLGGIIVEIEDDKIYHFRQVQSDSEGGFADLGMFYKGDAVGRMVPKLVMGDYHAGEQDETAVKAWEEVIDETQCDEVFFHDMFNGQSINHHEDHNIIVKARRASQDKLSLAAELKVTGEQLDRILARRSIKKGVVVKSNHDDFLMRWLQESKFKNDPANFKIGCELAALAVDGKDPIQAGIDMVYSLKFKSKLLWLERDQDYRIGGVECGAHGDKGPNGSRGSKASMESAYGKAIIGHSHTPGILRGIYQVGTSSLLRLGYNIGPSSWVHCSCLIYPNGQRQLINSIKGKWRLKG